METMNASTLAELAKLKQGARATWAAGDFPAIAQRELWGVGPRIVDAVGIRPGEDVLDVACGTGNAALRAAKLAMKARRAFRRSASFGPTVMVSFCVQSGSTAVSPCSLH